MPSLNLCNRQATVRRLSPAQDKDLSLDGPNAFPDSGVVASGAWCVAQKVDAGGEADEAGRVSVLESWLVGFPPLYDVPGWGLKRDDRIDLLAADGVTVTDSLYVVAAFDGGGRGESYQVPCEKRK